MTNFWDAAPVYVRQPEELLPLVEDRVLETVELHPFNDFYGHATLLKQYAGLPLERSLKVAIEHGVMLYEDFWDLDLNTSMEFLMSATQDRADYFTALHRHKKRGVAFGPLILYAKPPALPPAKEQRTLLVFPVHSSQHQIQEYDEAEFVQRIHIASRDFDETVICYYWKDLLCEKYLALKNQGFLFTSAGHMYDPLFLVRLWKIIYNSSAVYTNEIGSQILYSVLLNKPIWVQQQNRVIRTTSPDKVDDYRDRQERVARHPNVLRLHELFGAPVEALTQEQTSFIHQISGVQHFKSPQQLRAIFRDAERRYIVRQRFHRLLHNPITSSVKRYIVKVFNRNGASRG